MPANISVKTKIRVNGQDYRSVDDMPPDVRQTYERALAAMAGAKHGGLLDTMEKGVRANAQMVSNATKVIFNGREYSSVEQMPANVRHLYQAVIAAVEPTGTPTAPETDGAVQPAPESGGRTASLPTLSTGSSVRLEATNWRLVLVAVAILVLAWLEFGGLITSP
jgi:hypothetical protein